MKKIAVILSGCGVFDGAEIHESVLALLAIEQNGATWHCFAPDINHHHVLNHITGEEMSEQRNVLVESARIARGNITDIKELKVADYDALLLPGGFGVAKNLSDFAFKGASQNVLPEIANVCKAFKQAAKPAGYICIAPTLIPSIYQQGVLATIGNDPETAQAMTQLGAEHINCYVDEIVFDEANNVLSTPAYMLAENISQAASGINKLVEKLVKIA